MRTPFEVGSDFGKMRPHAVMPIPLSLGSASAEKRNGPWHDYAPSKNADWPRRTGGLWKTNPREHNSPKSKTSPVALRRPVPVGSRRPWPGNNGHGMDQHRCERKWRGRNENKRRALFWPCEWKLVQHSPEFAPLSVGPASWPPVGGLGRLASKA